MRLTRSVRTAMVAATVVILALAGGSAQTGKPAFEVASVRPATPKTPLSQRISETRLDFVNTSMRAIILTAFRIEPFQLVAPGWFNTTNFDIHATFPAGSQAQAREMLQTLLAERFGLTSHVEQRPVPAYELMVGKDGVKMREAETANDVEKDFSTDSRVTASTNRVQETVDGPVRTMMIPFGGRTVTTRSLYDMWTSPQGTIMLDATRITMPELAQLLILIVDRPVVDKTGLTGVYQFKVELGAAQSAIRSLRSAGITKAVDGTPIDQPTGVSTPKALEGLGLKLEDRRSPFDMLVIDKMEQTPREN